MTELLKQLVKLVEYFDEEARYITREREAYDSAKTHFKVEFHSPYSYEDARERLVKIIAEYLTEKTNVKSVDQAIKNEKTRQATNALFGTGFNQPVLQPGYAALWSKAHSPKLETGFKFTG